MQNDGYQPYPERPQTPSEQTEQNPFGPPLEQAATPPPAPTPRPDFPAGPPPKPPKKPLLGHLPKVLAVLGILAVVLLSLIGGYILRDQTGQRAIIPVKQASKDMPHTVSAIGRPGGTTYIVTAKLGFAPTNQAIEYATNKANPGTISQFSTTTKDEMGRWMVGDPEDPTGGKIGDITLVNLVRNTYYAIPVPKSFHPSKQSPGYGLQIANTPFSKASALKDYATRITQCAADPATGVVVSDFMNICVTPKVLDGNKKDTFHSQAVIEGYGKSNDVEFILLGTINLESSAELTPAKQKQIAADYEAAVNKASQDNTDAKLPDYMLKRTDAYRTALSYSMINIENTAK